MADATEKRKLTPRQAEIVAAFEKDGLPVTVRERPRKTNEEIIAAIEKGGGKAVIRERPSEEGRGEVAFFPGIRGEPAATETRLEDDDGSGVVE